jgi:hypothetical protein
MSYRLKPYPSFDLPAMTLAEAHKLGYSKGIYDYETGIRHGEVRPNKGANTAELQQAFVRAYRMAQARGAGFDHGTYDREQGICPKTINPCMGVDTPEAVAEYTAAYREANQLREPASIPFYG